MRRALSLERVLVVGRGKLGSLLMRALRKAGLRPASVSGRSWRLRSPAVFDVVILAVRDDAVEAAACTVADACHAGRLRAAAVLHCAGRMGPDVLAPVRGCGVAAGKLHPLVAIADRRSPPSLAGRWAHVCGDPRAVRLARAVARQLGMRVWVQAQVDHVLYHAAAALLASGAVALCSVAADLMSASATATPPERVPTGPMLGALLASVACNVKRLGTPQALTGPVRRGDAAAVRAHLRAVTAASPLAGQLYRSLLGGQWAAARALGEADERGLEAIAALSRRGRA